MTTSSTSHHRNPVETLADELLGRQRGGERRTLGESCRRFPAHDARRLHLKKTFGDGFRYSSGEESENAHRR